MRRFVPIVIPAFILFAFLGLKWFLLLRPARWIFRFGMNAMGLSLLAYAAYGAQPFLFLKEYRGSVAFVEAVNAALPEDRLIFGDISSRLMVPLAIGWSRPIVRVDLERTRDLMAMEEIVSRYREGNDSLYLLTDQPWQTPGKYKRKTEFAFQYPLIKPTARPPAREILRHSYRLVLYECEESSASPTLTALIWGPCRLSVWNRVASTARSRMQRGVFAGPTDGLGFGYRSGATIYQNPYISQPSLLSPAGPCLRCAQMGNWFSNVS